MSSVESEREDEQMPCWNIGIMLPMISFCFYAFNVISDNGLLKSLYLGDIRDVDIRTSGKSPSMSYITNFLSYVVDSLYI